MSIVAVLPLTLPSLVLLYVRAGPQPPVNKDVPASNDNNNDDNNNNNNNNNNNQNAPAAGACGVQA
jgi:hypothetical protein